MSYLRSILLPLLGASLVLATPGVACADHASEIAAQALYNEAMTLMKAGKVEAACPLFVESQRLDPAMGTLYRLAECREKSGRIEAAWKLYREAAEAAKKAGRADREQQAQEHAAALHAQLPWLVINVSPAMAAMNGLAISRDGQVVHDEELNREMLLAAGEHTVEVKAPGKKSWQQTFTLRAGAPMQLMVPVLEIATNEAPPTFIEGPSEPSTAPSSISVKTRVVIAGAGATTIALGVGTWFLVSSFVQAAEVPRRTDAAVVNACQANPGDCFYNRTERARATSANTALWGFIAAGALGAGTLTYAIMTPKSGRQVSATAAAGPGGAAAQVAVQW